MLASNKGPNGELFENTALILLYSVSLSAIFIFLLGMLSIFTHFVYIKLIYGDEIRNAAYVLLKRKNKTKEKTNHIIKDETKETTQING